MKIAIELHWERYLISLQLWVKYQGRLNSLDLVSKQSSLNSKFATALSAAQKLGEVAVFNDLDRQNALNRCPTDARPWGSG